MRGIILVVLVAFLATEISAQELRVVDADTLKLGDTTFRLHGIDAPEFGQKCNTNSGGTWECGKEATKYLQTLLAGRELSCDDRGTDGYGRVIAVCVSGSKDINSEMVRSGFAWAFRKYSLDYASIEDEAKLKKLGVWQSETQTPWDFRAAKWEFAVQEAPKGCPIKGNISKSGRIYHAPWSPWYDRTKVSLEKGERWFCNEAEAVSAGWRAPIWGG